MAALGSGNTARDVVRGGVRKKSSGSQIPGQWGVAAATVAMVAIVVGLAQIPSGAWMTAGGATPLTPPYAQAPTAPTASVPGSPSPSNDQASTGPAPATADPAGTVQGPTATPTAGQPPTATPTAGIPTGAAPGAQAVQRVTDSCSRRLQSDAANSGIVSGTVVPRPYSLVSVEYVGTPRRSTAGPGLESYDVELSVTTQPLDGPAQTDRRVCRVYDYDSRVDWLPAG